MAVNEGWRKGALAILVLAASAAAAMAQQSPQPIIGAGNEPIEIVSDKLEVREKENLAVFTGNVQLVQGKLTLRTVRMTVHYTGQPQGAAGGTGAATGAGATEVERIEAEGRVYLKSGEQVATGDQGFFDMKSDTMVLTGKEVVLSEGGNVVKGCKLTMRMSSGQSEVDSCKGAGTGGRVIMLLQPKSGN